MCLESVYKLNCTEAQERVCLKSALHSVNDRGPGESWADGVCTLSQLHGL